MALTPPPVSVSLSIQPTKFPSSTQPELSITAINGGSEPITIYTWPTIFNLELAQKRKNFFCINLNTNEAVNMELTKGGKRPGYISFVAGGRHDCYFVTLEPQQPTILTTPFNLAMRPVDSQRHGLEPGHRFRLGVQDDEKIVHWWIGRKSDILVSSEDASLPYQPQPSEPPIQFPGTITPIEFEVVRADTVSDKTVLHSHGFAEHIK